MKLLFPYHYWGCWHSKKNAQEHWLPMLSRGYPFYFEVALDLMVLCSRQIIFSLFCYKLKDDGTQYIDEQLERDFSWDLFKSTYEASEIPDR